MKKKILVLDNLAGIWPHSLQLTQVVKQLDTSEVEVHYLSCGSAATSYCTVQESRSKDFSNGKTDRSICRDCKFTAKLNNSFLSKQENARIFLSHLVDSELIVRESNFLETINPDVGTNLEKEICGVPVVRYALYETILKFKKLNLDFSEEQSRYFIAVLRNSVRFALLGEKYFSVNNQFHAVMAYTPQYAMNNSFLHSAEARGIKVYFVDGNGNVAERNSAAVVWNWHKYKLTHPGLANWKNDVSHESLTKELERIKKHRLQLMDGRSFSVYSAPNRTGLDILEFFKIPEKVKLWTLALSSVDEAFAAQLIGAFPDSKYPGTVFRDQFEWVKETVDWVANKTDIFLIIRMHPRDLPNKREKVKSEQAFLWEKFLSELPDNVKLNHPSDEIPLNALLKASDAFITGWSSAALEAMGEGLPVVTYDSKLPGFPAEIHMTGNSRSDYFANLVKLSRTKKNVNFSEAADSWLIHLYNKGSVRLTGRLFQKLRISGPKWFPRALNAADVYFPYIFRPIEALIKVRRVKEGERINRLVLNSADDLYGPHI